MEIETRYAVKLFFPSATFVQVYHEAVANSLDAGASEVAIDISADGKICPDNLRITITDNGRGFSDDRFDRFRRLTEPSDPYHKGLGRLVFLHYFSSVEIDSVYGSKRRTFTFSDTFKGSSKTAEAPGSDRVVTVLRFSEFRNDRLRSYDDIKPAVLKEKLLEHFLPLFHERKKTGKAFKITITLSTSGANTQSDLIPDSQSITALDIPEFQCKRFKDPNLGMFAEITMFYVLRPGSGEKSHITAACVDGRTIPIRLLSPNAIPLDYSIIFLFESELFTGKSDSSRQRLVLPDTISEPMLLRVLRNEMSAVLSEQLPEIHKKNGETKQHFEDRYPHLTGLFEEDTVGIIDKDEALEIAQRSFFKKQKEVLESGALDDVTFEKWLEVSSRTLTEYILYRELIIERLGKITKDNKEHDVHNLIVPQYARFHSSALIDGVYTNNAWLLDDKFMSFRTILSEATMEEFVSAMMLTEGVVKDDGRPDIAMIFSADPANANAEMVDVVVIEIKRKGVNAKENAFAATQLVMRAEKLVEFCPAIQRIWYYAVIEIDDAFSRTLLNMRWVPLFSRGKVFYQDFPVRRADGITVPTPICLLSYDAVIQDAAARNHTFLEILRNGFKKPKTLGDSETDK